MRTFFSALKNRKKVFPAYIFTGLELSGVLNKVLTHKETVPVTAEDMIKLEDLVEWPHMLAVEGSGRTTNVDWLIGSKAARLLKPGKM